MYHTYRNTKEYLLLSEHGDKVFRRQEGLIWHGEILGEDER